MAPTIAILDIEPAWFVQILLNYLHQISAQSDNSGEEWVILVQCRFQHHLGYIAMQAQAGLMKGRYEWVSDSGLTSFSAPFGLYRDAGPSWPDERKIWDGEIVIKEKWKTELRKVTKHKKHGKTKPLKEKTVWQHTQDNTIKTNFLLHYNYGGYFVHTTQLPKHY